jgi:hypothetical protein
MKSVKPKTKLKAKTKVTKIVSKSSSPNKQNGNRSSSTKNIREAKKKMSNNQAATANEVDASSGNIDKIRDIIFGGQMRDYDKRFARLEERLLKESADLRDETRKRFDALEQYIKQEVKALGERISAEKSQRNDDVKELEKGLKDLTRNFEKKTTQIEEAVAKGQSELRQNLLDQSKSLSDDIKKKHDEIVASLEREANDLREDKTGRTELAALFSEVAMRLNNEFNLPGE